jgi:hypothetical protein
MNGFMEDPVIVSGKWLKMRSDAINAETRERPPLPDALLQRRRGRIRRSHGTAGSLRLPVR